MCKYDREGEERVTVVVFFFLNSCWVSDNLNNLILRIYDQTSNFSMIHELS